MTGTPKHIGGLLGRDEFIEREFNLNKRFSLKSNRVVASNFQIFIKKNDRIARIPYEHISSVELKQERNTFLIILGILHSLAGAVMFWFRGEGYSLLMIPAGIFIIWSGFFKTWYIELKVSEWKESLKIKGSSKNLDSLLKFIMEMKMLKNSEKVSD